MTKRIKRIKNNLLGSSLLHKRTKFKVGALQNRQCLCPRITSGNGWNTQLGYVEISKEDLDFPVEQEYRHHSRISAK